MRPQVIEVPAISYAPMPRELTAPLAPPAPPPMHCTSKAGTPTWCIEDALAWIEDWRALLTTANQDRARVGAISTAAAQAVQP